MAKKKEVEMEMDLDRDKCHVCGAKLKRNIEKGQQWCIARGCSTAAAKFSIPYKEKK